MNSLYLTEAFKELNLLNEEAFDVDEQGLDDFKELVTSEEDGVIDIIDDEAEDFEEIEDSYVGKVVIDCCVCHSKIYKDADAIVIDEESDLANVGEECPYCYSVDGYKIIGKIAPFEEESDVKVEIEDKDNDGDMDEVKVSADNDEVEEYEESLKVKRAAIVKECKNTKKYGKAIRLKEEDEIESIEDKIEEVVDELSDEAIEELTVQMIADYIVDNMDRIENEEVQAVIDEIEEQVPEDDEVEIESEEEIVEESKECDNWKEKAKKPIIPSKKMEESLKKSNKKLNELFGKKAEIYQALIGSTGGSRDMLAYNSDKNNSKAPAILKAYKEYYEENTGGDVKGIIKGWNKDGYKECQKLTGDKDPTAHAYSVEQLLKNSGFTKWCKENGYINESLDEDLERVELETDNSVIKISEEPKEEIPDAEMIEPLDAESEKEIVDTTNDVNEFEPEGGEEEAASEGELVDQDVEEFEEEDFNDLGESYLKKVYDNVDSFKTSKVSTKGNTLKLEGIITFKSGNRKSTTFLFEAKDITKKGKVRFIGENQQITRGKKSFTLIGSLKNKKLIAESLNYNYRTKDASGKSIKLYGTIKR